MAQFKQKLDKLTKYEGIYDTGEEKIIDLELKKKSIHNLMSPCNIVALLIGADSINSQYLKEELRLGMRKKRAIFRLEGKRSLKGLGKWKLGISVNKGDMATVKRVLDWLNWPYF
jgi:hypothetical protein